MCGIVAYSGPQRRSLPHDLLRLLKALEYRGYDSAGVLSVGKTAFSVHRRVGSVSELIDALRQVTVSAAHAGMAHTRWATHGAVNVANAHPIVSNDGLAIVLNGVVENDAELRHQLATQDAAFVTDSDTATLLAAIGWHQSHDPGQPLATAVAKTLASATGRLAMVVASQRDPESIVIARRGSPLFVGTAGQSVWVASDPSALPATIEGLFEVADETTLVISRGQMTEQVAKSLIPLKRTRLHAPAPLGAFASHFEQEIASQERSVGDALDAALGMDALARLGTVTAVDWGRVLLVGCGSAHFACLTAKQHFEAWVRLPTDAVLANEFLSGEPWVDGRTLVIAVSQSGETADTLAAASHALAHGATLIAVTNNPGSSLARMAHHACDLAAGPEVSVASTKAYTAMLIHLTLLAAEFGMRRKTLALPVFRQIIADARTLPQSVGLALHSKDAVASVVESWRMRPSFLFIGRGHDYPTALEGALKLRELAYRDALGLAAGELKHGTIALVDEGFPVIAVAADSRTRQKTLAAVREVQARGADVLTITMPDAHDAFGPSARTIHMPPVSATWAPVVTAIPLQWLALHMATALGRPVDRPRNLAKSVTVV